MSLDDFLLYIGFFSAGNRGQTRGTLANHLTQTFRSADGRTVADHPQLEEHIEGRTAGEALRGDFSALCSMASVKGWCENGDMALTNVAHRRMTSTDSRCDSVRVSVAMTKVDKESQEGS